jgi:hypothetical protein
MPAGVLRAALVAEGSGLNMSDPAGYRARSAADRRLLFAAAGAQAATILITWPLLQAQRDATTPLLPLLPGAGLTESGFVLLGTLAAALRWPRSGAALHVAVLVAAIAADQVREQPQVLSLALLLLVAAWPQLRTVGAVHLAALWCWSGLGKLLSWRFLTEGGAWLLSSSSGSNGALPLVAAAGLGVGELALGLLALAGPTRRLSGRLGMAFHGTVLLFLVARGANAAVWPFNAALAVAAPALLGDGPRWRASGAPFWAAAALVVLLPLGWYTGHVDRVFAHSLYTLGAPRALWLHADGRVEEVRDVAALRVPLPLEPRVFAAWFAQVAGPGDRLAILERRPLARLFGAGDQLVPGPREALAEVSR